MFRVIFWSLKSKEASTMVINGQKLIKNDTFVVCDIVKAVFCNQ